MPTSTVGRLNNQHGFTLLELALVLLIIGLFSTLTLPYVSGMGGNKLDASARRLAGVTKYLYNEAALTGREHRLLFNLDRQSFEGQSVEDSGQVVAMTGSGGAYSLPSSVRFKDVQIPGRGKYTEGEHSSRILPVGWMDETVVHLQSEGGKQLTLRMNPYTGLTEVFEGYREFE